MQVAEGYDQFDAIDYLTGKGSVLFFLNTCTAKVRKYGLEDGL